MASSGPTPPRRRLRSPLAVALGAVLLAVCGGLAYMAILTGDHTDTAPAAPDGLGRAEAAGAPAGSAAFSVAVGRVSDRLAARAKAMSMRELGASLADARHDGGSPVAVVTERTELRAAPGGRVVDRLGKETEFGSPRVHAVVGHDDEWLEVMAAELPNERTGWVRAFDVDVEGIDHSLHVSLEDRTLAVRQRGRVVRRVPVTIGGPATPTPTGAFAVTDKLRMRDEGSAYGCCAMALTGRQPTIPQGWSGGDRLAVHGTPDETTVGQAASLGCFRAADADMRWLIDQVPLGTPVVVSR